MQNDFAAKGGMFERAGIDISVTRAAIGPTARALAAMRLAGIGVIYLKMGYLLDLSDLGGPDAPNRIKHLPLAVGTSVTAPNGRESRILIRDTWNTDILDELKPQPNDTVLYKTRYSGFYRRSRLHSQGTRYQVTDFHRSDDLRLRRLDNSRRHVQGLFVRFAARLHRRTHWKPNGEEQS
jgi:nicotinamidase-related amidase